MKTMRIYFPQFPEGSDREITPATTLTWKIYQQKIREPKDVENTKKWYITDSYFDNVEVLPLNASQMVTRGRHIGQYNADHEIYIVDENNDAVKWERVQ